MLYSEAWPKGKFYNSAASLLSNVADCMFAFYWFSGLQFYAFAPNQSTTSIKDRKRLSVQSCFKEFITWVCMIHRHVWSSAGSEESLTLPYWINIFQMPKVIISMQCTVNSRKLTQVGKKELQKVLFNFKFSPRKISFSALPWQLG